ncbi:MAG: hypothetical protein HYZ49_17335 [Chloroflexi bacterium]|nr:hypothetical protein [Chloroflexota bacterium]
MILASFAIRLHALLQLPGYVDEGLHLRWASEIWQGHLVFPFSTAKPLEIYYLAALLPFQNPLWVGRAGSVLTDVVILSAIWALAYQLGSERTGLWAVTLYALSPWTFFHERLAIADSLAAASAAILAWAAVVWSKRPWSRRALGLTICLIALPLAKLSAVPLMLIPLVAAWRGKSSWRQLILPYLVAVVSLAVVFGLVSLRYEVCGLCIKIIFRANISESAKWSTSFLNNINDLVDWAGIYLGVVGPLMLTGAVTVGIQRRRLGVVALAGFLLGSASLIAPTQSFPRYYLAALAFGSLLAAEAVEALLRLTQKPLIRWGVGALVIIGAGLPFAFFAAQAYRDPSRLKLSDIDRFQHVAAWSSGYAIREAVTYLTDELAQDREPAIVYAANQDTLAVAWLYWPPTANTEHGHKLRF